MRGMSDDYQEEKNRNNSKKPTISHIRQSNFRWIDCGVLEEFLVCAKFAQVKDYGRRTGFTQNIETEYYSLDVRSGIRLIANF